MTRKVWFTTDDYGNLWRFVSGDGFVFWYDAPSRRIHDLFMSWGDVDDWGSPLDWASYPTKEKKHMRDWITALCPTVADWQASMIAEHTLPERRWHGLTEDEFRKIVLDTYNIDLNSPGLSSDDHLLWRAFEAKLKEKNT